jgi:hypothetical protein
MGQRAQEEQGHPVEAEMQRRIEVFFKAVIAG